jgi:hypothetical protein
MKTLQAITAAAAISLAACMKPTDPSVEHADIAIESPTPNQVFPTTTQEIAFTYRIPLAASCRNTILHRPDSVTIATEVPWVTRSETNSNNTYFTNFVSTKKPGIYTARATCSARNCHTKEAEVNFYVR